MSKSVWSSRVHLIHVILTNPNTNGTNILDNKNLCTLENYLRIDQVECLLLLLHLH